MPVAAVDSGVLIDYKDTSSDSRHERAEEIEYLYAFDDDFDSIDRITRLATADNPFA